MPPTHGLYCLHMPLRHGGQLPQSLYWFWCYFPVQIAGQYPPRGWGGEAGLQGLPLRGEPGHPVPVLPGSRWPVPRWR